MCGVPVNVLAMFPGCFLWDLSGFLKPPNNMSLDGFEILNCPWCERVFSRVYFQRTPRFHSNPTDRLLSGASEPPSGHLLPVVDTCELVYVEVRGFLRALYTNLRLSMSSSLIRCNWLDSCLRGSRCLPSFSPCGSCSCKANR